MVVDRIKNWFNLSRQYFFTYGDGFFNLTYLANSPEVIVKSSAKFPFMKHDMERQMLHMDSPFIKGKLHYVELEEGLWIMHTDLYYKNNLCFKPIYDNLLPSDYYFISSIKIENKVREVPVKFNDFAVVNNSIAFSKPNSDLVAYHFKNSTEKIFILYFNKGWAKRNIIDSSTTPAIVKELFEDEKKEFLNYAYENKDFKNLMEKFTNSFVNSEKPNVFELKKMVYDFVSKFFDSLERNENLNSFTLSQIDKAKMQKIEHQLSTNLYAKFPGIEVLAKKYKVSPTKLKQDFKTLYGTSIFKYFQKNKMQLALKYLEDTDLKIKDIASKLGYENESKFSKTFQKIHQKLPSEHRK